MVKRHVVRIAIQTDVDYAKKIGLVLDSGLKLGCDVPSTNPPIHLWTHSDAILSPTPGPYWYGLYGLCCTPMITNIT